MPSFKVNYANEGKRLDAVLTKLMDGFSRTHIAKLIDEKLVTVNGEVMKASYKVEYDDVIEVTIPEDKPLEVKSEDIPLDIVYEDGDIIIINKPQGMVVHPSVGHEDGTLVNAILHHCNDLSGINGVLRPGIVHRIDKDTSGLICVAKNDAAHTFLAEQLKDHTMARTYYAIVRGVIKENSGTINMPIGRDQNNRQKMAVVRDGKPATTHFTVIERCKEHTLISCSLVTGRTHQIRVHMSHIGYPVEGDPLYAGKHYDKIYDKGQLLMAYKLTLIHPTSKKEMTFEVDIPNYFKEILTKLK